MNDNQHKLTIGDTPEMLEVRVLIDGKVWSGADITKMAKESETIKEQNAEMVKLLGEWVRLVEGDRSEDFIYRFSGVVDLLNKLRG